ncbi:MAG: hypothetical protein IJH84_19305 [Saccharopolyspora sp.]|uniref:hypothetical protein n=1 Tax=Saccharopolyspora sp. TaxID=33915 RepID=UPI0025EA4D5D|nr:hypothetical protein [Saccharopolyspora sp.]MBQ6643163.1 hypothetical protein [Saccharopolyspora sp.]
MDERVRQLLLHDLDGAAVEDPDEVIYEAYDDPRYFERVPALRDVLADDTVDAQSRFLACFALTAWAQHEGYDAVIDAAAAGSGAVWFGAWLDRRYSVDTTFAQLAEAVSASRDLVSDQATGQQRLTSLRALLKIADAYFFDWQLAAALGPDVVAELSPEIFETVHRAIANLNSGTRFDFPLSFQTAEFIVAAARAEETRAVSYAQDLLAIDSSAQVLHRLIGLVEQGREPASKLLADSILTVGGEEVRAEITEALDARSAAERRTAQVTYYAKIDELHPRSDPRGLVRRRILDGVTHDEAFTRQLDWEPTEYLKRYAIGHNEIDHVEITEQEADEFVQRMTRKLGH